MGKFEEDIELGASTFLSEADALKAVEEAKEEAKERRRSFVLNRAEEIVSFGIGASFASSFSPVPTEEELRGKLSTTPIDQVGGALAAVNATIALYESFPLRMQEVVVLPDNDRLLLEEAARYLREIKAILQERLNALEEDQKLIPQLLKQMNDAAASAEKLRTKIDRLASKYQSEPAETLLQQLIALVKTWCRLNEEHDRLKRKLMSIDSRIQPPILHDLPHLPRKVWKKIQG